MQPYSHNGYEYEGLWDNEALRGPVNEGFDAAVQVVNDGRVGASQRCFALMGIGFSCLETGLLVGLRDQGPDEMRKALERVLHLIVDRLYDPEVGRDVRVSMVWRESGVDESGDEVPRGEVERLAARGDALVEEFWGRLEAEAQNREVSRRILATKVASEMLNRTIETIAIEEGPPGGRTTAEAILGGLADHLSDQFRTVRLGVEWREH